RRLLRRARRRLIQQMETTMSHEHRLLLALSSILKVSYPHLDELHAAVEANAARAATEAGWMAAQHQRALAPQNHTEKPLADAGPVDHATDLDAVGRGGDMPVRAS